MSQFAQHYAHLHDEELIELALRQELVPEASEALQAELARRGIGDLASHQAIRQREAIAEETHRQSRSLVGQRSQVGARSSCTQYLCSFAPTVYSESSRRTPSTLEMMAVSCLFGYSHFRLSIGLLLDIQGME